MSVTSFVVTRQKYCLAFREKTLRPYILSCLKSMFHIIKTHTAHAGKPN